MTKEEILKSRERKLYFTKSDDDKDDFTKHFRQYEFLSRNDVKDMGQYFLYENYLSNSYGDRADKKYDSILTYPKLGVYLNSLPCDQTIEVEWVDCRRTWEWRTEYDYEHDGKTYQNYIAEDRTEIKRLALWSDSMLVYGVWDSKPNWKQLKQAYERTWWFHRTKDELRDIQLNRLLV